MSKVYETLYRDIWDEHRDRDPKVDLDAVDEDFVDRVVIDFEAAKTAACRVARRSVDTARTKFQHNGQLTLPTMANEDEYLVTAESQRAHKATASDSDFLASLAISDENLARQFAANQARHVYYRAIAPYLHRGMTHNDAVQAYYRDHPDAQAAD